MATLYINAPRAKAETDGRRSYEETLTKAIGDGYAIPKADAELCIPGSTVIVLCKDKGKQAQGQLKELVPTGGKNGQNILQYDVHIENLQEVPYGPTPNLRRQGVLVVA